MSSEHFYRKHVNRFNPETIEKLEFSDCLNLILELQQLGIRELRRQQSIKIIQKLESRIKHLGRTKSYKCMAALPAVNALVA